MLAQRVITAVVLLALLLPTLWLHNPWPFNVLTLVLICAAAWEWARLNGYASGVALLCGVVLAIAGLAVASLSSAPGQARVVWWAAAALWLCGGVFVLKGGPERWAGWPRPLRLGLGLALLALAWWALAQARIVGVNHLRTSVAALSVATNSRRPSARARAGRVWSAGRLAYWCWLRCGWRSTPAGPPIRRASSRC
jgi:phosphatidate cytidylyltransferase